MVSSKIELPVHVCFTVAGMDMVKVKNQEVQTEIVLPVEQHVQAGSIALQQGMYTTL